MINISGSSHKITGQVVSVQAKNKVNLHLYYDD